MDIEDAEPPVLPVYRRGWIVAVLLGLFYGLGVYAIARWLDHEMGLIRLSFLFGVPVFASMLAVVVVDPSGQMRHPGRLGLKVVAAMLVAGIFVLKEGGVCTLMAGPIFLAIGPLAAIATAVTLRRTRGDRRYSNVLLLLPLVGLPIEGTITYPQQRVTVASVVDIAAPPARVWATLVEVRYIHPRELGWTFAQDIVGLPKPVDARLVGTGLGAVRHVRWGGGVAFDERITDWQPGKQLGWAFEFWPGSIPARIEANLRPNGRALRVEHGSYSLAPLANGGTRLTLRTTYRMRTPLNAYAAWWGEQLIGDFHTNVLKVIDARSGA